MKKKKINKKGKMVLIILFILIAFLIYFVINNRDDQRIKSDPNVNLEVKNDKEQKVITNNNDNGNEYKLREGEVIVGTTNKGYMITELDGITYVDGVLIVNKTYPLPSKYQPQSPYKEITNDYLYGADYIEDYVMEAYLKMEADAKSEGLSLKITSGYRSYSVQNDLYNNYAARDGKEAADTYSARAGHSEHQSGLCFDLNGTNPNFINTPAGKWLNDNSYKYGFILRYPNGATNYTGYMYEGWHFRYVGVDLATKLYNNGNWLSLEEYYGITSEY